MLAARASEEVAVQHPSQLWPVGVAGRVDANMCKDWKCLSWLDQLTFSQAPLLGGAAIGLQLLETTVGCCLRVEAGISWGEFFDSKTQAVKKVWNWLRLGLVAPDLGMRLLYAFEEDAGTDMTILDHKLTLYEDVAACLF